MKTLVNILMCSILFVANVSSNENVPNKQSTNINKKNCGLFVSLVNYTSSSLTISYLPQFGQIQTVTVPTNGTVNLGNYAGNTGSWTFRILGGLNGSIASFDNMGTYGVTECITTSSDERFYVFQNPFAYTCGGGYSFLFADYPQCN